jgi:hypothetical protein
LAFNESLDEFIFRDLDGDWKFDKITEWNDTDPFNDSTNAITIGGETGGLYAFDSSSNEFTFQDFNGNRKFDYFEYKDSTSIICLNPDNDTVNSSPMIGNIGGLWAFDSNGEPFIFCEKGTPNWKYDESEIIINYDPDFDGFEATPRLNEDGYLVGWNNSANLTFLFKDDLKMNYKYDIGESFILINPFNSSNASKTPNDSFSGGYVAYDSSPEYLPFTFLDNDKNFIYRMSEGDIIMNTNPRGLGIASPQNDTYGGLYAVDKSGNPFTFNDTDHDYRLDFNEVIINYDPGRTGDRANPWSGVNKGGLYTLDNEGNEYLFDDDNGNGFYDSGETIINDDPNNDGKAEPEQGVIGGIYARSIVDELDTPKPELYVFIDDISTDWILSNDEKIISYDPDNNNQNNKMTLPAIGHIGGLWAIDSSGEPYIFQDVTDGGNRPWIYDNDGVLVGDEDDIIVNLDPDLDGWDATPEEDQDGGLIGWDDLNSRTFLFKDDSVTGTKWMYDIGDSVITKDPFGSGIDATENDGDLGGLVALDRTPVYDFYSFKDEDNYWNYSSVSDKLTIKDGNADGQDAFNIQTNCKYGGLMSDDTSGESFTFKDRDSDWTFNKTNGDVVISYDPDGNGKLAEPQNGDEGGLYAQENIYIPGQKNTAKFDYTGLYHWIVLRIVDNFGMKSETSLQYQFS